MREEKGLVGLRNLGATCYMNALLQCLYMNKSFREGVYQMTPSRDIERSEDACMQLVELYSRLQVSNQKYLDPSDFISSIKLNPHVQQDPQEFYSLFIALIERRHEGHANSRLKDLIKNEFGGKYRYVTTCQQCGNQTMSDTEFNDLSLSIKGNSTLSNLLKDFSAEESMTDGNQYNCESCQRLVDATRKIEITALPPVINFQLLRFYYDQTTGQKRKRRSRISFPQMLDMASYVNIQGKQPPSLMYELSGILIHKGTSAYGGHYVAHLKDDDGKWWVFDDESVKPLDTKLEDIDPEEDSKKKEQKKEKEEKGNIGSCNAYMLIYSLQGRNKEFDPTVPKEIQHAIQDTNDMLVASIKEYQTNLDIEKSENEAREILYNDLWKGIHPKPKEEFYWISREWLQEWIKGEKTVLDNHHLLCQHGFVDFHKISKMKRISSWAWQYFWENSPDQDENMEIEEDSKDVENMEDVAGLPLVGLEKEEEKKKPRKKGPILSSEDHTVFPCLECLKLEGQRLQDSRQDKNRRDKFLAEIKKNVTDGYYIAESFLKEFRKKDPNLEEVNPIDDLECPHGGVNPRIEFDIVTKDAWEYFSSIASEIPSKSFSTKNGTCKECTDELDREQAAWDQSQKERLSQRKKYLPMFEAKSKMPTKGVRYAIPKSWQNRWKQYVTKDSDSVHPGKIDQNDLICDHGRLRFDPTPLLNIDGDAQDPDVFLVDEKHWQMLIEDYDPETPVTCFTQDGNHIIEPEICTECSQAEFQKKRDAKIHFENGELIIVEAPSDAGSSSEWQTIGSSGSRRSNRIANKSGGKQHKIEGVNSHDTIQQLKLRIFEVTSIAPFLIALTKDGVAVDDDDKIISSYEIENHSHILLTKRPEDTEILDEAPVPRHTVETGFSGTGLTNFPPKRKVSQWTCDACTLENDPSLEYCGACEAKRPDG
eukprot:TRINITY_DN5563_c0_g1_i1.p1 TRINITY_DN5563_c0_g1~~TRINITY_DN5563_c0_g1_i1.p1  ORF type:complete len:1047 (+),score=301.44 TRINITY_DN5563_c0_g1_i1:343-3141(+)